MIELKRILDIVFGVLALVLFSPLLLTISLLILCSDGMPVIFRQQRVGQDNRLFTIYKFRTMKKGVGNIAKRELPDYEQCLIRGGKFLRRTSLDELPQLLNIVAGDMSFVGPRPLIPEETEIRQMRLDAGVYAVRPGVTGLAQVSGRDTISDEEKTAFDKQYVEHHNLWVDFKILCKTVAVVLTHRGMGRDAE